MPYLNNNNQGNPIVLIIIFSHNSDLLHVNLKKPVQQGEYNIQVTYPNIGMQSVQELFLG